MCSLATYIAHSIAAVSLCHSPIKWMLFSITIFEHIHVVAIGVVLYYIHMYVCFIYQIVALFMSYKIVKSELQ